MLARLLTLLFLLAPPAPASAFDQEEYLCREVRKPFFKLLEDGSAVPGRAGSADFSFRHPKPPGTQRVFVIGESAAGLLAGDEAFFAKNTELINCGMGAYDSRRIRAVFLEAAKLQPDLAVVLSGNNEGGADPCGGLSAAALRLLQKTEKRFFPPPPSGAPRVLLAAHERRLRRMARLARRKKIPLVICSLPVNLLMPPFGTAPYGNRSFAEGLRALEEGDYAAARRSFGEVLETEPREVFSLFYDGLARYRAGDPGGALSRLQAAADLSPAQDRAGPARNRMLKKVAEEEGACFADLEGAFRAAAPDGIPGFTQFNDTVHWARRENGLVWKAISSAAGGCGIPAGLFRPAGKTFEETGENPLKKLSYAFAYSLEPYTYEMSLSEIGALAARSPQLLARAADSPEELSRLLVKSAWFEASPEKISGGFPLFLAALGEHYRRGGKYSAALRLAEKALGRAPENSEAAFLKGAALFGLGRKKEARKILDTLGAGPEIAEKARGFLLARGVAMPSAAVKRSPVERIKLSSELSEKGRKALELRQYGRAAVFFRQALAEDPNNRGAAEGLRLSEAAQKKTGEGIKEGS